MALIKHAQADKLVRDAVVLDLGDLVAQGEAIVSRARAKAKLIVEEAEFRRDQLLNTAEADGYQAGESRGYAEGFERGRAAGHREAVEEARAWLVDIESGFTRALKEFSSKREALLTDAHTDVLRLSLAIAERVIKRAVETDREVVVAQLRSALALVSAPTEIVVGIHPEDRETIEAALPGLHAAFHSLSGVHLREDAALDRGSCVVTTRETSPDGSVGHGEIDASIRTQIQRIASVLLPGADEPDDRPGETGHKT